MEAFFNKAICCKNVPYLWGKKFRASLKVRKKQLVNRFVKILENYGPLCIFRNYANYVLRAELCNFTSAHNSGSPVNKNLLTLISTGAGGGPGRAGFTGFHGFHFRDPEEIFRFASFGRFGTQYCELHDKKKQKKAKKPEKKWDRVVIRGQLNALQLKRGNVVLGNYAHTVVQAPGSCVCVRAAPQSLNEQGKCIL